MTKKIKDKNIFRPVALEQLSTPDQLDQMIQVLTPKSWLLLVNIVFLVTIIFLWGIFGSVSLKVYGNGILIKRGGIHNVTSNYKGRVHNIYVDAGDIVEKEQVVASILVELTPEQLSKENCFFGRLYTAPTNRQSTSKRIIYDMITPFTGKVLEIKILSGNNVNKGSVMMHLETLEQNLESILYISPQQGKKITIGSVAQIVPTTIRKERFGFIEGEVISVSEFPATRESMINLLKNPSIVNMFSINEPPIEIVAKLQRSSHTFSGYKWSSQLGPQKNIHSGTICEAEIVYETQRPIVLLFLWLREIFSK